MFVVFSQEEVFSPCVTSVVATSFSNTEGNSRVHATSPTAMMIHTCTNSKTDESYFGKNKYTTAEYPTLPGIIGHSRPTDGSRGKRRVYLLVYL